MDKNESKTAKLTYSTLTIYLITEGANQLIKFLEQAFDAQLVFCESDTEGKVKHAEVQIGDSKLMLSDATADYPATPVVFYLFMDEVDPYYQRALKAGATSIREPRDEEYGHRSSGVKDFAGNQWWIASEIKK